MNQAICGALRASPRIVIITLLASACGAPAHRAATPAQPVSDWGQVLETAAPQEPLAVIVAEPSGHVHSDSTINIVFSHPMRSMTLAEDYPIPPIEIDPPLPGQWQWVGTSAVTRVGASAALVPATRYQVKVSGAARDVSGRQLGMPYLFEFETERPELLRVAGTTSALGKRLPLCSGDNAPKYAKDDVFDTTVLRPDSHIAATFNLAIDPTVVRDNVSISAEPLAAGNGKPRDIAFDVKKPCPEESTLVELIPRQPLPRASRIIVRAKSALKSTLGPLDAGADHEATDGSRIKTYGPLTAEAAYDVPEQCNGLQLVFSNPVHRDSVDRLTLTEPWVQLRRENNAPPLSDTHHCFRTIAKPGSYLVRVRPQIKDIYGQLLTGPSQWDIAVAPPPAEPQLVIGATSGFIDPGQPQWVKFKSENIAQLSVKTVPLGPKDIVEELIAESNGGSLWDFLSERRGKEVQFAPAKRAWTGGISLLEALRPNRYGAVGLHLSSQSEGTEDAALLHPTNLAITTLHGRDQLLVWVARLSDARPVSHAKLTLHTPSGSQPVGETGPDGIAVIAPATSTRVLHAEPFSILVAEQGSDWAYLKSEKIRAEEPTLPATGALFVDRGVYRPGDTVYAKGWLFQQTLTGVEPVISASVQVSQVCGGEEQAKKKVTTNAFGAFSTTFRLSPTAKLASCYLAINQPALVRAGFNIEEYRRLEYLGAVTTEQTSAIQGEPAWFNIAGTYLFGLPMRGAKVQYWTSYYPVSPTIAADFVTDAHSVDLDQTPSDTPTEHGELNASGRYRVSVSPQALNGGPTQMTLHAGVEDATHQLVGANASVLVHPASFYLGLRSHSDDARVGGRLGTEVIAVDPTGKRLGGKRATVELRAHERLTATESGDVLVARCTVKTVAQGVGACQLPLTRPGKHTLMVSGKDEHGRTMRAGKFVWVTGASNRLYAASDDEYPPDDESGVSTTDAVGITLDRTVYKPGDIAHTQIDLPWQGMDLLVAVESDRVHWHKRLTASNRRLWLNVPIPADLIRNGLVVVYAAMGRRGPPDPNAKDWDFDPKRPRLEVVAADFAIDPNLQRLEVEVLPEAPLVLPGAKVKVALRVCDRQHQGRKAEVTLFAVDEGVLALTGYQRPDPLEQLLGIRAPSTTFANSREALGLVMLNDIGEAYGSGGLGLAGTGTGGGGSSGHPELQSSNPRKDFAVTPYFNAHIVTADDGTTTVVVPLSDALTRYRLMAVAVTQSGESGSQEASIQTRKPLMLRASMPRLLRAGDEANVGAIVMNETEETLHANVALDARGIVATNDTSQTVDVLAHQSADISFTLKAQTPGTAKLQLTASAGRYRDSIVNSFPISLPVPLETVASYGQATPRAVERLGDLTRARTDIGNLDVQISSTALLGLDRSLEQLVTSRYDCTEQLISSVLPDVLLRDMLRLYGVQRDITTETKATLKRLLERQQADGGFTLWPLTIRSHPWVSVYALLALREAKARGIDVPQNALVNARNYATKLLEGDGAQSFYVLGPFAAYALARAQSLKPEQLNRLWRNRRELPFSGQALLLELLAEYRSKGAAAHQVTALQIKELRDELVSRIHFDGANARVAPEQRFCIQCFDSETRSAAFLLDALLELEPKSPLVERLARGLLNARKNGTWRSTQESVFALLALDKFRRVREAEIPEYQAKVWLNSHLLGEAAQRGRSLEVVRFSVPVGKLEPRKNLVEFTGDGEGTAYYEMRLDYAPKQLPAVGLDRGFAVAEKLYRVTSQTSASGIRGGSIPETNEFQLGDIVTGRVRVSTPTARDFVAVEVPVPAGFELLDQNLKTTFEVNRAEQLTQADAASHVQLRDDRIIYYIERMTPGDYDYQYLARVTSVGHFQVPPAQVLEMYSPEVFGRTSASLITVK